MILESSLYLMFYSEMFLKMYFLIHLTIKSDVEVTFTHHRFILDLKFFDVILYIPRSSIILSLGATLYLICFMVKIF